MCIVRVLCFDDVERRFLSGVKQFIYSSEENARKAVDELFKYHERRFIVVYEANALPL